jgi:flagella basal body P-ring formation protein FlgA
MKTWIKVLLIIGLLSFTASMSLAQPTANEIAINKVYALYSLDKENYSIEVLSDGLTTEGVSELDIEVKPLYQTTPLGRFTIVATVTKSGKVLESRQIRLFIRKFANVLVATDRISRLGELSEESILIERKEITDLREQPLTEIKSLSGQRARRNLAKGIILTTGDIEPLPAVKSHRDIHLIYVSGLCRVTSKGETLQDGQIGEFIKVRNKSSGKIVLARVVDETTAAVGP